MKILLCIVFVMASAGYASGGRPVPAVQTAPAPAALRGSVLVRAGGDARVAAGEAEGLLVVVAGDAEVYGRADVVVVAAGNAVLVGAEVGELLVLQGQVLLEAGSTVTGDIHLVDAVLAAEPGAQVGGRVRRGIPAGVWRGFLAFGVWTGLGYALVLLAGGLVFSAVAPSVVRSAGVVFVDEPGGVLVSTFLLWIVAPLLALGACTTAVGAPFCAVVLVFVLPVLGFLGYLATGAYLGDALGPWMRRWPSGEATYVRTLAGTGLLVAVSWLPYVGALVAPVAAVLGGATLVLVAWNAARRSFPSVPA